MRDAPEDDDALPPCPLGPAGRAWVEARTGWILEHFPPLDGHPVQRIEELLGSSYDGSPDSAMWLFARVRERMRLGDVDLKLGFYSEQKGADFLGQDGLTGGTAGHYVAPGPGEPHLVRVNRDKLDDGHAVAATLAHEMAHVLLIGLGRLGGAEPDGEPLTDLLTVFTGFGVINANSVIRERNTSAYTSVGNLGYLRQEEFAYALALLARLRGDASPAWREALCADVREWFDECAAYLEARGGGELDVARMRRDGRRLGIGDFARLWSAAEREGPSSRARVPWCLLALVGVVAAALLLGLVLPASRKARERPLHVVNGTTWTAKVTVDGVPLEVPAGARRTVTPGEGRHAITIVTPAGEQRFDIHMETSLLARMEGGRDAAFVLDVLGSAGLVEEVVVYGGDGTGPPPAGPRVHQGPSFLEIQGLTDIFTDPPRTLYVPLKGPGTRRRVLTWPGQSRAPLDALRALADIDLAAARAILERHLALRPDDSALIDLEASLRERRP